MVGYFDILGENTCTMLDLRSEKEADQSKTEVTSQNNNYRGQH